jgi:hypothetical protein
VHECNAIADDRISTAAQLFTGLYDVAQFSATDDETRSLREHGVWSSKRAW